MECFIIVKFLIFKTQKFANFWIHCVYMMWTIQYSNVHSNRLQLIKTAKSTKLDLSGKMGFNSKTRSPIKTTIVFWGKR